jgi:hypothetical protein
MHYFVNVYTDSDDILAQRGPSEELRYYLCNIHIPAELLHYNFISSIGDSLPPVSSGVKYQDKYGKLKGK